MPRQRRREASATVTARPGGCGSWRRAGGGARLRPAAAASSASLAPFDGFRELRRTSPSDSGRSGGREPGSGRAPEPSRRSEMPGTELTGVPSSMSAGSHRLRGWGGPAGFPLRAGFRSHLASPGGGRQSQSLPTAPERSTPPREPLPGRRPAALDALEEVSLEVDGPDADEAAVADNGQRARPNAPLDRCQRAVELGGDLGQGQDGPLSGARLLVRPDAFAIADDEPVGQELVKERRRQERFLRHSSASGVFRDLHAPSSVVARGT